jgi:hypothetical protein
MFALVCGHLRPVIYNQRAAGRAGLLARGSHSWFVLYCGPDRTCILFAWGLSMGEVRWAVDPDVAHSATARAWLPIPAYRCLAPKTGEAASRSLEDTGKTRPRLKTRGTCLHPAFPQAKDTATPIGEGRG